MQHSLRLFANYLYCLLSVIIFREPLRSILYLLLTTMYVLASSYISG